MPFQGETEDGEDAMMVKGVYYYDLQTAPHWYYQDETSVEAEFILEHVVMTDIKLEDISLQNQPHSRIRAKAYSAGAQKISDESHYMTWMRYLEEKDLNMLKAEYWLAMRRKIILAQMMKNSSSTKNSNNLLIFYCHGKKMYLYVQ